MSVIKIFVWAAVILIVIILGILVACDSGTRVKKDEDVVFYPTSAYKDGDNWVIPIHGRIYEPERKSIVRNILLDVLSKTLGRKKEDIEQSRFKERGRLFLEDNERNKKITISLNKKTYQTKKSAPNGHFYGAVKVKASAAGLESPVRFKALKVAGDRVFEGVCYLLEPGGVMVISDIDDTIKESQSHDTKATLEITFFEEFEAIPGMAGAYAPWREQGASFHYVSGSPWQLYAPLREFLDANGFPGGDIQLKHVRISDPETLLNFFKTIELKLENIEKIMVKFPRRKFILVGDSGEKDPEVYGDIARKYPDRLLHIFIRKVETGEEPEENPEDRFKRVFENIPADKWTIFTDPNQLKALKITALQ
jgi:phosphatidate phosphatase APP1